MIKRKLRIKFFSYIRKDENFKAVMVKNAIALFVSIVALIFWVGVGVDLLLEYGVDINRAYLRYLSVFLGLMTVCSSIYFDYKGMFLDRKRHDRARRLRQLKETK